MNQHVPTSLKGFLMGAANVVPGVSGGTMALITGIYSNIVEALNSLMSPSSWKLLTKKDFKGFWKAIDGGFLLSLAIGILVSIFSLAALVGFTLEKFPVQTWAFFFGLIVASAIYMLAAIKEWKFKDVIFTVAGIALGLVVCTLTPTETPDTMWFLFICGAIAICTMILPGVSGSFILVVLCKYDYVMGIIADLDIVPLAVFAAGCLVGILAFAKALHALLARWERPTMLVLIGFVIGSLVKVWPWANVEVAEGEALPCLLPAIIWCVIGIVAVILIEKFAAEKK